jgi:hypothetical protein
MNLVHFYRSKLYNKKVLNMESATLIVTVILGGMVLVSLMTQLLNKNDVD